MQLNTLIARQIVERATKIIQYPVNVMDENGQIIGSSDPKRLHKAHDGALLAIHDNRTVEIRVKLHILWLALKKESTYPSCIKIRLLASSAFRANQTLYGALGKWSK